jgi:3-oxoacyl-[acyl-carrier protein] reductase
MNLQLRAKRALVTGNSSGIGESIVRTLACEGVTVVVRGRNRERARRVGTAINQEGGRALVAIGDLATDDGASAVAQQTLEALGGLDILINDAGGIDGEPQGWSDAARADWRAMVDQNLFSAIRPHGDGR